MKLWVGIALGLLVGGADAQVAAPPAAMKAPVKLEAAKAANGDAIYQALRARTPNGASFTVKDLTLKRDAGVLTFSSGAVYLYGPVNGKVTGAVFLGEGSLHIDPPSAMEKRELKAVMKTEVLDQRFTSAVMSFTDGTGAELQAASGGSATGAGAALGAAQEAQTLFRRDLKYDLEERLLEDLEKPGVGEFFMADLKGGGVLEAAAVCGRSAGCGCGRAGGGGAVDVERLWLRCDAEFQVRGAAQAESSGGQPRIPGSAADDRRDD